MPEHSPLTSPTTDCYYFASHKTHAAIQTILGDYQGYLQSDAYICYELIAAASEKKIIGRCFLSFFRQPVPLLFWVVHVKRL